MRKSKALLIILSIAIIAILGASYAHFAHQNAVLDPSSYACMNDAMMKQACAHPYTDALLWTALLFGQIGTPLLIAWLFVFVYVLTHRTKTR